MSETPKKIGRWYFGGVASAMAASCTHPLDLIKVHLQTQKSKDLGMVGMGIKVVRNDGVFALYNGISASILRQLTYSLARFGIFETYKANRGVTALPFAESAAVSMSAGFIGGIVGNPADMVNVRMQNDMKVPPDQRRNYKNAIDGLFRVVKGEGVAALFSGVSMTSTRAAFMTFGQLGFYDKFKTLLIASGAFQENVVTHVIASVGAAGIATCMTQPFDTMKTRIMNSSAGSTLSGTLTDLLKSEGPVALFKGLTPAFIRLGPHTILTFVFLEQLKSSFGTAPIPKS
ncbi:hypothetical protein Ciccas_009775 [Cichlidogyrus casuarinus]|uniref:Mitochondrial dicarboxylate carrier n=1 Tax=Cichlidogyrus casuarinus TaxID=1844966 RepID=A0ABD2PW23_9PLAT